MAFKIIKKTPNNPWSNRCKEWTQSPCAAISRNGMTINMKAVTRFGFHDGWVEIQIDKERKLIGLKVFDENGSNRFRFKKPPSGGSKVVVSKHIPRAFPDLVYSVFPMYFDDHLGMYIANLNEKCS